MAGSAVIGSLRVGLGLDSAQFTSGLKKSENRLAGFGKTVANSMAGIAVAASAALAGVSVAIGKTISTADEMTKSAQKFGVPVDQLSRLKHAADLSGVSIDTLGTGLRRLSDTMLQVSAGASTSATRALEALDVTVQNSDGSLRSSSDVMTDIAGKLSQMQDGAAKTAAAMAIFGRSGADLIPMLNAGRDGLAAMLAEADALGITLDRNTGQAAERFNDNLTRLGKITDGFTLKLTAAMLPALEKASEAFLAIANDGEKVQAIASGLTRAFAFVSNEIAQLAIIGNRLSAEFAGISEAFGRLKSGDFRGAWSAWLAGQEQSVKMSEDLRKQIDGIFSGEVFSQGQIQRRIDDAFGQSGASAGASFVARFAEASKTVGDTVTKTDAWKGLRQAAEAASSAVNGVRYAVDSFVSDMRSGLEAGEGFWKSFGSAAMKAIDRLVDALLNDVLDAMFKVNTAGSGGGFLGAIGSIVGGLFGGRSDPWAGLRVGSNAMGTSNWRGGLTTINERGGELVNLPGGTQIIPNHELKTLFGGSDVKVEVHNYSRSPARVEEGRGPNGEAIRRVIIDEVREGFGRGDFDPSMRGFNTRPARAKR